MNDLKATRFGGGRVDFSTWGIGRDKLMKIAAKDVASAIEETLADDGGLDIGFGWNRKGRREGDPLKVTVDVPIGAGEFLGPRFAFSLKDLASNEFIDSLVDLEELAFARDMAKALRRLADRMDKKIAAAKRKHDLCEATLEPHQIPIGGSTCLLCGFTAADTSAAPAPAPRSPSQDG